ncbi:MATE family efflux transporter [uncultured Alistipes sp.]|uniref:MATE family efflux transporter n=1 Tax=uncultured Alistipes sp. TaxID=538949 RepID=UPI0026175189|nr:MATE family efflux transporter [uncultured Alistipes sp.]
MPGTANRIIKNTGFLYAKMGVTMFISLYTTRLILNSLGASDFGIFNIVGGAISMLGFLNAAMAGATQRFMSFCEGEGNKEKQKSIFNISIILHAFVALLAGLTLLIAGYFFFNGILNIPSDRVFAAKIVYGSLIISTIFTVTTVPYDAILNAHENMKYYALIGVFEALLKLLVALIVVYISADKLIIYGILMACIPLITLSVMRAYCHRNYEECIVAPKRYWDKVLMKEMTGFAGWNFVSNAVIMISSYGQGIILNHFFGTILNAAQGLASQISGQLQVLSSNMLKALNPLIGKSAGSQNRTLFIQSVFAGSKFALLLYIPFAIPFFIEAPYILKIWLKEVPEWTTLFVRFSIISMLISFASRPFSSAIQASGEIKGYSIWTTILNIVQLPIIYILFKLDFPPYVLYIVALLFGHLLVAVNFLYYTKKHCGIELKSVFKMIVLPITITIITICFILSIYVWLFPIKSIYFLFIYLIFSIIISGVSCFYLACNHYEKQIITTQLLNLKTYLIQHMNYKR